MKSKKEKTSIDINNSSIYNDFTDKNHQNNMQKLFEENKKLAYKIFQHFKYEVNMEDDDFLQECYIILWKAIKNYNPKKGKLSTLAFHIASNWVADELRKKDALKQQAEEESEIESIAVSHYGDDFLSSLYIKECENEIISKLGIDYKQALIYNKLRLQGYNTTQIKEKMNYSDNDLDRIRYKIRSLRKKRDDFML